MPKANIKKLTSVPFFLLLLVFSGCSNPEEKKAQSLEEIAQLRAAGDDTTALTKLESLSSKFPDDSAILQQIGSIHQKLGNTTEAAFYLSTAFSLAPDDLQLLYQNYRAQEDANQSAAAYSLLVKFAADNPTAMTSELWLRLGELHAKAKETQAALDAYLKGITSENETLDTEIVIAVGTLFKQLDNFPQAERWLTMAAKSEEPNALPALFGLLEIYIHNENWNAVEKTVSQLDRQFPGAIDASEWVNVRDELKRWQKEQAKLEEELPEIAANQAVDQPTDSTENPVPVVTPAATTSSGKARVITDAESAAAFANMPALEMNTDDESKKSKPEETRITHDPTIIVEPAEPDIGFNEAPNQIQYDEYAYNFSDPKTTTNIPGIATENETPTTVSSTSQLTQTPQTLDDLLAQAETATFEGNYETAIRLYREALEIASDRADIWNTLSSVYLVGDQLNNAAAAALEATRLNPEKVEYVLDYLRVVQSTKEPADFITEVETAYDRFPRSPEINLSLARAYQRLNKNINAAKILYKRFIELAPNHPLRPEAEAALEELR